MPGGRNGRRLPVPRATVRLSVLRLAELALTRTILQEPDGTNVALCCLGKEKEVERLAAGHPARLTVDPDRDHLLEK